MEKYIANGQTFDSYESVVNYAKENNLRVSNTETIQTKKGNKYLITLNSIS